MGCVGGEGVNVEDERGLGGVEWRREVVGRGGRSWIEEVEVEVEWVHELFFPWVSF